MQGAWFAGDFEVTQSYGCTDFLSEGPNPNHPECPAFHDGLDLALPCGTPIVCPVPATCVQVGLNGGGPFALILDVGGWWVWLLHLQAAFVSPGQQIAAGMIVGESGTLGFSTGCHLHFEVTPAGGGYRDSVDPGAWLSNPLGALAAASSPSGESSGKLAVTMTRDDWAALFCLLAPLWWGRPMDHAANATSSGPEDQFWAQHVEVVGPVQAAADFMAEVAKAAALSDPPADLLLTQQAVRGALLQLLGAGK